MLPSTNAVLRSHIQLLEVMAARMEELALRSTDFRESAQLRQFAKAYQLVALEHRTYLDDAASVGAA